MKTALIDGDILVYAAGFAGSRGEEPQLLEHVLSNARRIIDKILRETEVHDYKIFLTGEKSFRKEISNTYKANRDESHKPQFFQELKDYLINHHDAEVTTSGIEADDAMGLASNEETVICTLDKDLDTVPGWHYNWRRDHYYHMTSDEADMFFWEQMLMGDAADNIKGVPGIGPVRATKLLHGVEKEHRPCIVGLQYAMAFDDPETEYTTNANLLWILR